MNFIKAATIAISAVIACGAAEAKMPKEVNIVYVKAPFNLQNMVIKDQKLLEKAFAKDGVKVNWKTITSGAQQSQAMAAGSVDVSAVMNTASLLLANGAGNPVQIATGVAHPSENFAIVVKSGSIKSIKDLKGKRVAGPRGTVLQQLLLAALAKNGMKATDAQFISMGIPESLAAVTSGRVDAALLAASAVVKAEESGCRVLTTAKGLVDVNLVMTARKGFADESPEALATIVKVNRESLKWIKSHWKEAIAIGAKEQGISVSQAETLARRSHYYDVLTQTDIKGLEADQKFLVESGLMAHPVNVKSLILPGAMK